jgi:hypothetical protein
MTDSIHADTVAHPTPLEVLKGARELLSDEDRWTQGVYARDDQCDEVGALDQDATCWCLVGALVRASGRESEDYDHEPAVKLIARSLGGRGEGAVAHFNDAARHPEVIAALDRAIEQAEQA